MARLYSQVLFASPAVPSGTYNSSVVPADRVWIVREVEVIGTSALEWVTGGFSLTDGAGAPILQRQSPFVWLNRFYHLTTRQVLDPGDQLVMTTGEYGWSWRVSGYELTLP